VEIPHLGKIPATLKAFFRQDRGKAEVFLDPAFAPLSSELPLNKEHENYILNITYVSGLYVQ